MGQWYKIFYKRLPNHVEQAAGGEGMTTTLDTLVATAMGWQIKEAMP